MARIRFESAREVFEAFPSLSEDLKSGPSAEHPVAFMRALLKSQTPEDALTFCAHTLPRREAVWWGCQCVRQITQVQQGQEDPFLRMAEKWVREPEDHVRMAALRLGLDSERRHATNWLALAAGWSGGNISVIEGAYIPAKPEMTGSSVRTAILIALSRIPAAQRAPTIATCLEAGIKLMQQEAAA